MDFDPAAPRRHDVEVDVQAVGAGQPGPRRRRYVLAGLAALGLVAAALVSSRLLLAALGGAAAVFALLAVLALLQRSSVRTRLLIGFAAALVVTVPAVNLSLEPAVLPLTDSAVGALYSGLAELAGDGRVLQVEHRLLLDATVLGEWPESEPREALARFAVADLPAGWQRVIRDQAILLTSTEEIPLYAGLLGTGILEIPPPEPSLDDTTVYAASGSLVLTVPGHVVHGSEPPPSSRRGTLGRAERIEIPVATSEFDDVPTVRIEVLGRLLRNPIGSGLADVSLWEPLRWVVMVVAAALAARARGVIERWIGLLVDRLRRRPAAAPA